MKKDLAKVLLLLMLGFFVTAPLLSGEVSASGVNKAGVKVMQKERLGKFLAAGNGMTLYSFTKDEKNAAMR